MIGPPRRFWSEREITVLKDLYPNRPTKEVAETLGRAISGVYRMAAMLGLKKSQEFLDSDESGRLRKGQTRPESVAHQFQKGIVPANKGLRRPGWHAGRMKETQFKKGERTGIAARNWVPVGTILADSDGYLRIKVREAVSGKEPTGWGNPAAWPQYHRYVWEQAKGPIPPKHIVTFKDRDKKNCAIDNLELISMADNARRNAMWNRMPQELIEVIQLNGALKRKIGRLDGAQQD